MKTSTCIVNLYGLVLVAFQGTYKFINASSDEKGKILTEDLRGPCGLPEDAEVKWWEVKMNFGNKNKSPIPKVR